MCRSSRVPASRERWGIFVTGDLVVKVNVIGHDNARFDSWINLRNRDAGAASARGYHSIWSGMSGEFSCSPAKYAADDQRQSSAHLTRPRRQGLSWM